MKIVDFNNQEIKAAFQFVKGNCLISVSTIMDKQGDICIFKKNSPEVLKSGLRSIEQAIKWVDAFGPRD